MSFFPSPATKEYSTPTIRVRERTPDCAPPADYFYPVWNDEYPHAASVPDRYADAHECDYDHAHGHADTRPRPRDDDESGRAHGRGYACAHAHEHAPKS